MFSFISDVNTCSNASDAGMDISSKMVAREKAKMEIFLKKNLPYADAQVKNGFPIPDAGN